MKAFRNLVECVEYFKKDNVCRAYLENARWKDQPACPHCGSVKVYRFANGHTLKCGEKECNKKFNVLTRTIFENTKIPLQKWFAAIYLITSHKKGISSVQLGKDISVTQKTAWFLNHRIRQMLENREFVLLKGTVECDETYVGGSYMNRSMSHKQRLKRRREAHRRHQNKFTVMGAVERGGRLKLQHIPSGEGQMIPFVLNNISNKNTRVFTDEFRAYKVLPSMGYEHAYVTHGLGMYSQNGVSTNTIEGAFSILKRGYIGIYHYMSGKHLQRYCNEFSYRYNTRKYTEKQRLDECIKLCERRLKYKELIAVK